METSTKIYFLFYESPDLSARLAINGVVLMSPPAQSIHFYLQFVVNCCEYTGLPNVKLTKLMSSDVSRRASVSRLRLLRLPLIRLGGEVVADVSWRPGLVESLCPDLSQFLCLCIWK